MPFCGHATIATGVALAERDGAGTLVFHTKAGTVPVHTEGETGGITATLTSVEPHIEVVDSQTARRRADALGWANERARPGRCRRASPTRARATWSSPPPRASGSPTSTTTSTRSSSSCSTWT